MVLCCPNVLQKSVFKADVPNSGQARGELIIFLLLGENLPHHILLNGKLLLVLGAYLPGPRILMSG